MPSEWAMNKAEKLLNDSCGEIADTGDGRETLAMALDAARIEGLEEAAKIVDDWPITGRCGISSAIRARIEEIKA